METVHLTNHSEGRAIEVLQKLRTKKGMASCIQLFSTLTFGIAGGVTIFQMKSITFQSALRGSDIAFIIGLQVIFEAFGQLFVAVAALTSDYDQEFKLEFQDEFFRVKTTAIAYQLQEMDWEKSSIVSRTCAYIASFFFLNCIVTIRIFVFSWAIGATLTTQFIIALISFSFNVTALIVQVFSWKLFLPSLYLFLLAPLCNGIACIVCALKGARDANQIGLLFLGIFELLYLFQFAFFLLIFSNPARWQAELTNIFIYTGLAVVAGNFLSLTNTT